MIVGFCNGCFDRLHRGHRFFLEYARDYCDWLIVAVNSNEWVKAHKGAARPFCDIAMRMRDLRATTLPDAIIPFNGDPVPLLQQIRPDLLSRGEDQSGEGHEFADRVVRVPRLQGFSTTELAGRHFVNLARKELVMPGDAAQEKTHAPK